MVAVRLGRRQKMKTGDLIRPFNIDGGHAYEYRSTTYDGEHKGKKYFRYLCLSPTGGSISFPTENEFWYLGHKDPTDLDTLPKAKSIWESNRPKAYGPHPNPPARTRYYGDKEKSKDPWACKCQEQVHVATMKAHLTPEEDAKAVAIGTERHDNSWKKRYRDTVSKKDEPRNLAMNVLGARGEKAWSFASGMKWYPHRSGFGSGAPDFEPDIEIRVAESGPSLILRDDDMEPKGDPPKNERRFVLGWKDGDDYIFWGFGYPKDFVTWPTTDPGGLNPARFISKEALHRFSCEMW